MADIEMSHSNTTLSWDDALNYPISKHLLSTAMPKEGDLLPLELMTTFIICPRNSLEEVEEIFESVDFSPSTSYYSQKKDVV